MLFGLAVVLIPLFLGYLFKINPHTSLMKFINKTVTLCLYLILLVIGISFGQLDGVLNKLPHIGGVAFTLSGTILLCNIIGMGLYDKWIPLKRSNVQAQALPSRWKMLWDSFKLIGTTFIGAVAGFLMKGVVDFPHDASTIVLVVMIFGVGVQLRNSGIPLREVFLNRRGIITSLVMMSSSLVGGIIAALILGMPVLKGLAFSSAFGWYSLSSVLVHDAWGAVDGSIAFFNDISREIVCLFLIPMLMPRFPSTAVGVGGATSLDCMLPVIQKSGGTQIVPLSISFGFIVNLAAPLLLAIFIHLAS